MLSIKDVYTFLLILCIIIFLFTLLTYLPYIIGNYITKNKKAPTLIKKSLNYPKNFRKRRHIPNSRTRRTMRRRISPAQNPIKPGDKRIPLKVIHPIIKKPNQLLIPIAPIDYIFRKCYKSKENPKHTILIINIFKKIPLVLIGSFKEHASKGKHVLHADSLVDGVLALAEISEVDSQALVFAVVFFVFIRGEEVHREPAIYNTRAVSYSLI